MNLTDSHIFWGISITLTTRIAELILSDHIFLLFFFLGRTSLFIFRFK